MIIIDLDGWIIQMPTDFELVKVIEPNLFEDEEIKVPRTYEITIPDTPINQRALNYLNELRHVHRKIIFKALVTDKGAVVINGIFKASNFNGSFSGTLVDSAVLAELEGKQLSDFNYAADVVLGENTQEVANYGLTYHENDHVGFPEIVTSNIYGELNPAFGGIMNLRSGSTGKTNALDYTQDDADNHYSMLPCFGLLWLIERMADELGYTVSGDLFEQPNLQQLLLIGGKTLDTLPSTNYLGEGIQDTRTTTGLKSVAYDTVTGGNWNLLSYPEYRWVVNRLGRHRIKISFDAFVQNGYTNPEVRIELGNIFAQTILINSGVNNSVSFEFNHTFTAIGDSLYWQINFRGRVFVVIGSVEGTYSNLKVSFEPVQWQALNIYKQNLNYAAHMPQYSAAELITETCKTLGAKMEVNECNKVLHFNLKSNLINLGGFWDITDKIIPNKGRYFENIDFEENTGFNLIWDSDINKESRLIGEADQEIKLKLSACKRYDFKPSSFVNVDKKLWIDNLNISTDLTNSVVSKGSLKIAYHDAENAPMKLTLEDEIGTLWTTHLKALYENKNKLTPVISRVKFSRNDINKLQQYNQVMIDHSLFFLKKITAPLTQNEPGFCKLELFKIKD
jgi:hypothetical protein